MTSSEHQQLVEFLGRQFTAIDGRFTDMDRRFTEMLTELRHEMLGHFDEIYRRLDRPALQSRIEEIEQRLGH